MNLQPGKKLVNQQWSVMECEERKIRVWNTYMSTQNEKSNMMLGNVS